MDPGNISGDISSCSEPDARADVPRTGLPEEDGGYSSGRARVGGGGRLRSDDLQGMNLPSSQAAPPR